MAKGKRVEKLAGPKAEKRRKLVEKNPKALGKFWENVLWPPGEETGAKSKTKLHPEKRKTLGGGGLI